MSEPQITYERKIRFRPAFDRRDPNPHKNGGLHGVEICFALTGAHGAVVFVLYTPWMLDSVDISQWPRSIVAFNPADIGYHAYERRLPTDHQNGSCEWLDNAPCFYDGSGLQAERFWRVLRAEGDEGLWRALEGYYERKCTPNGEVLYEEDDEEISSDTTFGELFNRLFGEEMPEDSTPEMPEYPEEI